MMQDSPHGMICCQIWQREIWQRGGLTSDVPRLSLGHFKLTIHLTNTPLIIMNIIILHCYTLYCKKKWLGANLLFVLSAESALWGHAPLQLLYDLGVLLLQLLVGLLELGHVILM